MTASKGQFLRNKMYNAALKATGYTGPATLYMSLHTASPGLIGSSEVSGNAYARTAIALAAVGSTPGSGSNTAAVNFPAPTPAAYGPATYFGIWDALPAAGTGTVTIAAGGAATFSATQAGVLANDMSVLVGGSVYIVSGFNGTTGATLAGAPAQSAVAFTVLGNLLYQDALASSLTTVVGTAPSFPIGNVTVSET